MKKLPTILSLLALVIALSSIGLNQFSSTNDQVYVDVNRLMEGYNRTKVEREAFNKKATAMKANVDSLIMDWQQELKNYEKERASMTEKELELKKELLANKQQQVNNYQQAIQRQIQEEDQKVTQTVINDINDYVKEYGKEKGYSIIFGANGAGSIMYARESSDLTDEVLKSLNRAYEGS